MSKNTKICFVSYRQPFEVVLDNFSKSLQHCSNNYEVTLLANDTKIINSYIDGNNRKIIKLTLLNSAHTSWRKFKFALKVINHLNTNDYTIIHLDISCQFFSLIKILTKKDKLFVFHILSYPVTHSKLLRFKTMLSVFLQSLIIDKVIIQSQEIKDKWIGLNKSKNSTVIPVGFDKNIFSPVNNSIKQKIRKSLLIPNDTPVIVYSGVISTNRSLENLIYAMKIISEFDTRTKLLFIGTGKAKTQLQNLSKSLKLENSLIFTGFIQHEKVAEF